MTARGLSSVALLAMTLSVSNAIAEPRSTGVRELARSGGTDAERALRRAVERHVAEARLTDALSAYAISPSLVQLRRYVEPGRKVRLVCVVDLILLDRQGALLATVRGSASATGATPHEAVDAAAHAAVARLPRVLDAARARVTAPSKNRVSRSAS